MSDTNSFKYMSPVDFRIAQVPEGVPPELKATIDQVFAAIQQIISALITNCGIGPRNAAQQSLLAGSISTLLAGNLNRFYVTASENIVYGAAVNFTNSAGTLVARNANAANNTKPARAFCTSPAGILAGAVGEVQINAGIVSISGLTPGASYFLSTTSGLVAPTPAVGAGNIEQFVGFAVTSSSLVFNLNYWIQH